MYVCMYVCMYLFFLEREGKSGRKKRRVISVCGCLLHSPNWGHGLQPRHVPWLGIEPVTLWFTSQHSIHWATPARAVFCLFYWSHEWPVLVCVYTGEWSRRRMRGHSVLFCILKIIKRGRKHSYKLVVWTEGVYQNHWGSIFKTQGCLGPTPDLLTENL